MDQMSRVGDGVQTRVGDRIREACRAVEGDPGVLLTPDDVDGQVNVGQSIFEFVGSLRTRSPFWAGRLAGVSQNDRFLVAWVAGARPTTPPATVRASAAPSLRARVDDAMVFPIETTMHRVGTG